MRSSAPSGPRPVGHGRGQGRVPSQTLSWQTGSSNNPIVMSVNDSTDPWTDKTSKCWPLEEHHYAEVFAVCASFETDDPPLWSALLSPSARTAALRENRRHLPKLPRRHALCPKQQTPFINASGCLNPELGQLGDDDAYRPCQARMTSYRRDGASSRAHTKKNRRNRSGQTRRFHQDQDQVKRHSGNQHTSDYHGGVPPSPASSAPAVTPGMRLGANHNPSGQPNARQPGTFRTGN